MVGHGGSSDGSYLADPTSPIHCASIVVTSTLRVKQTTEYTHKKSKMIFEACRVTLTSMFLRQRLHGFEPWWVELRESSVLSNT